MTALKHYINNGDFRFVVNIDNRILQEGLDEMELNDVDLDSASVQCACVQAYHYWMDTNSPDGPKRMGKLTLLMKGDIVIRIRQMRRQKFSQLNLF